MTYRMKIVSEESVKIFSHKLNEHFEIKVGNKYQCYYEKPSNKKEQKEHNKIVEVLGFTCDFSPDGAIVRYKDTMRRGMVNPTCLIPYKFEE
ncbi:UNVERIFIED_CONTAM: hypothetical protein Cloal_0694 [Acetivibrio alkalicellulosi]